MPKGYGYGGESTMKKKGAAPEMKGQHGMMMKDQGQPMMKHGKGPHMNAELKYNAVDDITQGKGKGDFPFTHKHTSNSATKMVSPLEFHKGVPHPPKRSMLAEAKELPKSKPKEAPKQQLNEMLPTKNSMLSEAKELPKKQLNEMLPKRNNMLKAR